MGTVADSTIQRFSTAGNGGRKLVRLNNGWLVAAMSGSGNYGLYVSKDDGATFEMIQHMQAYSANQRVISIATDGIKVYALMVFNNGFGVHSYDSSRNWESSGSGWASMIPEITTYREIQAVSLVINPQGTELHAAWSVKGEPYPDSFNINYAKGTINGDGSVTWGAVEQVTTLNYSNNGLRNPCIIINSKGNPVIFMEWFNSNSVGNYGIYANTRTTNGWSGLNDRRGVLVFGGGEYVQSSPSAVVDKDGVIHVAWEGTDSVDITYPNIRASRSLDGGVTWITPTKLTSGNTTNHGAWHPQVTADKSGKVFIVFNNRSGFSSQRNISYVIYDNQSYSAINTAIETGKMTPAYPSTLYDATFRGTVGEIPPTIYTNLETSVEYIGTYATNQAPTITINSPTVNQTLYENDELYLAGTAIETDIGDSVTIRYQVGANSQRAIKAFISNGAAEAFSKILTFRGGALYDGETLIASGLVDGVAHTLKVWATDDKGGTSTIREIPFYVVPNRAPLLTVNGPVISGSINSDKFTVNGTFEDSDGNNTIVSYRLNGASSVQVAEGVSGSFEFELSFGQLVIEVNEIVVEAVDSYGAKVSKTVKLNKVAVETPLLKSTARYKVNPPTGSAKAVLLWIQRDENLDIDVSVSMTMQGEAESFKPLTVSNSAPLDQNSPIIEDEFYHEADGPKDNIILQIDMKRASLDVNDKIYLISGVLD